jgi:hypothetical protein
MKRRPDLGMKAPAQSAFLVASLAAAYDRQQPRNRTKRFDAADAAGTRRIVEAVAKCLKRPRRRRIYGVRTSGSRPERPQPTYPCNVSRMSGAEPEAKSDAACAPMTGKSPNSIDVRGPAQARRLLWGEPAKPIDAMHDNYQNILSNYGYKSLKHSIIDKSNF